MNRPGVGAPSLRGLPNGFPNQQQPLGQPRSTSSRLPNGKIAPNSGTWAFGGVPMGTAGLPAQRQNTGPITSFAQTAQTIGGSQPATPFEMSDFPSLSNNSTQQPSSSTWAMGGTRTLGPSGTQRPQQQSMLPLHQQAQAQQQTQQQQDDLISSSSQLPNSQAGFRFGSQSAVGQSSQSSQPDEFPPLSRNVNGDIGQDRSMNLLQNVGFGAQSVGMGFGSAISGTQPTRNNGLLNALSSSGRPSATIVRGASPVGLEGLLSSRNVTESSHQNLGASTGSESNGFGRTSHPDMPNLPGLHDQEVSQSTMNPQSSSLISNMGPASQSRSSRQDPQGNGFVDPSQESPEDSRPEVQDPLPGMSEKDRWGLKGLLGILNGPYTDQAALITGVDINTLGLDLNSTERFSEMIWSPFDDIPPRPVVPDFELPECYQVHNVQPIDNKMSSFSDETLMMMFYSNPQDIQQMIAAQELNNRNWRWHKKLQLWLTKDEMMLPQQMGAGTERGYYIFFDPKTWNRERRELVLTYSDLENVSSGPSGLPS